MMGQTIILHGPSQRASAHRFVDRSPPGAVLNIRPASRTLEQNAKLHAMISDVSRAKPEGRTHTPDVWKAIFLHAAGHAVQFEIGLNGQPFPLGMRTSRLNKAQCADLITYVQEYGDRHGVVWSNEA